MKRIMMYLICKDVYEDDYCVYISTEENAEKNDLVVYMDYERPSLAKVVNIMDELSAITSDKHFIEVIIVSKRISVDVGLTIL